jgi:hypothetical protein
MTTAQVYSWIFYAIAMATQLGPAKWAEVSMLADGINHAVPTHREMQAAISFCVDRGLIRKMQSKVELTSAGSELLETCKRGRGTIMEVWASLEVQFGELLS